MPICIIIINAFSIYSIVNYCAYCGLNSFKFYFSKVELCTKTSSTPVFL
jgi:hypothetical protein